MERINRPIKYPKNSLLAAKLRLEELEDVWHLEKWSTHQEPHHTLSKVSVNDDKKYKVDGKEKKSKPKVSQLVWRLALSKPLTAYDLK